MGEHHGTLMAPLLSCGIALSLSFLSGVIAQPSMTQEQFRSKVRPADARAYRAVRDSKDWKNPYLIILADALELRSQSKQEAVKMLPDEIGNALLALPASDWPYGRVLAVQMSPVRTDEKDQAALDSNLSRAEKDLKQMGIVAYPWP